MMLSFVHRWFIDRSVHTGRPPPAMTRRAESRDASLRALRRRLERLEAELAEAAAVKPPAPRPAVRQAVLDAARAGQAERAGGSAPVRRISGRLVLPIAGAAALAIILVPAWVAFRQDPGEQVVAGPAGREDPPRQVSRDTGIAVVLSAPRDLTAAPGAPLLEEARRLAADTRAVRDGLLARIPLIHAPREEAEGGSNGS